MTWTHRAESFPNAQAHGSSIGGSDDPELSAADDLTELFGGDVKRLLKSHFSLYGLQE